MYTLKKFVLIPDIYVHHFVEYKLQKIRPCKLYLQQYLFNLAFCFNIWTEAKFNLTCAKQIIKIKLAITSIWNIIW